MDTDRIAEIIQSTIYHPELGMATKAIHWSLIDALADLFEADAIEQCLNLSCEDCAGLDPEKRHIAGSPFDRANFLRIAKGE